jgi:hypothetical protein
MKNLLAFVGLLVVGFGGLGYYLDWYNIDIHKNANGKVNIAGDIDPGKIAGDVKNFGNKVGKVIGDQPAQSTPATGSTFVGPPLPASLQQRPDNSIQPTANGFTIPIEIKVPSPRGR